ncbi:antitoxin Xre/MbcA/ParS toxin-binding domain-containing protein [Polaromonas sp.]|uniref:antitoxin Xre/MbcA/ParS toxin-binding domain-containing protein n=1 Tax=Polaromonas sp. TaxID=1869339 RepID=UPI003BB4C3DD
MSIQRAQALVERIEAMTPSADLSVDEKAQLDCLIELIGQVQAMVRESGAPAGFDPARWLGAWIGQPVPALGGRKPIEFLDTAEGRKAVSVLLSQMQSGAYA